MPFFLVFSLTQKNNTVLMKALQDFFSNLAVSKGLPNLVNAVTVSFDNRIASKGEITSIYITRVDYIINVLIPFLDSLS